MPILFCVTLAYLSLGTNQARHAELCSVGLNCRPPRLKGDDPAIHMLRCKFARQY